ncbi:hypothetical protein QRZ34_28645 [Klebsiella michiganensis]|uniref:hypothetical protein n=1 Tax=Klebsiella michiganensis TaxID=1134687 RepID=UPI00256FAB08|nr:hypothetical protein [Klebsiella michiganensis]MDL4454962.1 hypothetical protein [Klebsiella michiganensis]
MAVGAGMGAVFAGSKGAAVGAALGTVVASQLGAADAMPIDVPNIATAHEAFAGHLQSEIDNYRNAEGNSDNVYNRLNENKEAIVQRYLADYRALYAQRTRPELQEMFNQARVNSSLSSSTAESQIWNNNQFVAHIAQQLFAGNVNLEAWPYRPCQKCL